jgi:methylphosphotriester-DNA--protein-cysteine methyltransferase
VPDIVFQPFPMQGSRRAQAWRHQPAFHRPRHFHSEPELNLVTRGQAVMGVGDTVVCMSRGDVLFLHPGQDHVLLSASEDLGLFVVALRPELAAHACRPLASASSSGCRLSDAALLSLEDQLHGLSTVADRNPVEQSLTALFEQVATQLGIQHVLTRRALQEVGANPEAASSELARQLGVHPSALSRRFHDDLSLTFVEYRARLRTMRFIHQVDGGKSLTAAALEAGFGSYAQCHRVISRALGCSPQRYFTGERSRIDDALSTHEPAEIRLH